MYRIQKFVGSDGDALIVHLCHPFAGDADAVEFATSGGEYVTLTESQFEKMAAWIRREFDALGKHARPRVVN